MITIDYHSRPIFFQPPTTHAPAAPHPMAAGQSSKAATRSPNSTQQQTRNKGRTPSLARGVPAGSLRSTEVIGIAMVYLWYMVYL